MGHYYPPLPSPRGRLWRGTAQALPRRPHPAFVGPAPLLSTPPNRRQARARRPASSLPGRSPACAGVTEVPPNTGSDPGGFAFKFSASGSSAPRLVTRQCWVREHKTGWLGQDRAGPSFIAARCPARPSRSACRWAVSRGASETQVSVGSLGLLGIPDPRGRVGEGFGSL